MSERDRNMIETLREGNRNLRADLAAAQAELRELRLLRDRVNAALTSDAWGNDLAAAVEGLASRYRAQADRIGTLQALDTANTSIIKSLRARIAELEAAARWIPVEERLPDDDGHYIVAVGEHVSRSPIDWTDRDVYECVYSGVGWHTANDVTHWQPLPQPPSD